ncbi:HNH endonuclease signature motif containing protein [Georgenia wangjunii]|uniref:HNH endonuclease signature motif containing protein n=1 Tax=Georgenia wangjunii TaxID=3117730 RepID=UPI002F26B9BF
MIGSLDTLIREATLYRGQLLLAHKEDGTWGTVRDRDFTDWRSRTTGTGRGAAAGELGLAEGLDAMPGLADAVQEGTITLEHAKTLTRLREHASAEVKDALAGELGTELLDLAADVPAPELAKAAKTRAAAIDAAAAQADFDAVHARRSFTVRRQAGGRKGEFFLNDVDGTTVDTAIDAIVGKPAKDDTRTREQRRADALVTMANRVLQVGADRNGAQIRPHLSLLVTEETWTDVVRHRILLDGALTTPPPGPGQPGHSFYRPDGDEADHGPGVRHSVDGSCGPAGSSDSDDGQSGPLPPLGLLPVLPDVAPAILEDGSIVPLSELQRVMCDCEMTRIVLDAHGVPTDVGQTQRHYTRELRRAVTARDRHCQWPECTLRASWCEVHHITWWSNGGATSIENGLTLCSYHHHRVHADHIRITTLPGGHAFHDRHGTPIGTSLYTARPKRSACAGKNEPDGLTPPRAGTTGTTLPTNAGAALPTLEGTALPRGQEAPPPAGHEAAPPTLEGTAPPTAQPTVAPTAATTAPPTTTGTTGPGRDRPPSTRRTTRSRPPKYAPILFDVGGPPF